MLERRKSQRFKVGNGHFIIHSKNVGKIEDISMGGLCCSCINEDLDPASEDKIDIRCLKNNMYLEKMGINILETEITSGASIFNVFTRICHLKFQKLTDDQRHQLNNFILHNAIGSRNYSAYGIEYQVNHNI
ncbi:MAG: PilZ domain-containing protein [Proteobacteria bacterium]|nr:PilZ domain-containing protein [Pseudomonadota bacterium]MBU4297568.1 PilZ domain-containing protein [Pseudomonadota bacterium]MCG2749090.1 PilZ domain-containing protein [Desulfobulbaceae bacterium]